MKKTAIIFFLFCAISLSAYPENTCIYSAAEALPGDVVPVLVKSGQKNIYGCRLFRGEKILNFAGAVLLADAGTEAESAVYLCLIGISYDVDPGLAGLEIVTQEGKTAAQADLEILERNFISETIPLNSNLTDVRTKNRERRRREARELTAVLETFNANALYANSIFHFPIMEGKWWPSSFYGDIRTYAYADGSKAYSRHRGLDYAADKGTPLCSSVNGRIAMSCERQVTGNTVVIELWPGIYLLYYHLDTVSVEEGQEVLAGQQIGTVGSTGLATGDHLHWEMRVNNSAVDPEVFLQKMLIDKSQLISIIEERIEKGR